MTEGQVKGDSKTDLFPGKLLVVSGPSGVGKSTVVKQVLSRFPEKIRLSVSAATRSPRPGEQDGIDYHFLSSSDFQLRKQNNEFLECMEVFSQGHWYGTLWSEVRPFLAKGKWVLLEIDVQGAQDVLESYPEAITLFIRPGNLDELEHRLRSRGTEAPQAIERRLEVARKEMEFADRYQYQVVNNTVEKAVEEICSILHDRGLKND